MNAIGWDADDPTIYKAIQSGNGQSSSSLNCPTDDYQLLKNKVNKETVKAEEELLTRVSCRAPVLEIKGDRMLLMVSMRMMKGVRTTISALLLLFEETGFEL